MNEDHGECCFYGARTWFDQACPGPKETVRKCDQDVEPLPKWIPPLPTGPAIPIRPERLRSHCLTCGFKWEGGDHWSTSHWLHYMTDKVEWCEGPIVVYCEIE